VINQSAVIGIVSSLESGIQGNKETANPALAGPSFSSERTLGSLIFLNKPCIVKMRDPNVLSEENDGPAKAGFAVSLFPWMPLSKEDTIPITADWLITMVEPTAKLKEMYIEDVLSGPDSKDSSPDDKSDSDN
jgi:hypothetical protein